MNVRLNSLSLMIVVALGLYFPVQAQQPLPELEKLLDVAIKNSYSVKAQQAFVLKQEAEAKRTGKLWLQSLQVEVGSRYYNSLSSDGAVPMLGSQSGLSMRISFYDLLAQKNIMARSRYDVQEAKAKSNQQEVVVKQAIVSVYYQAELSVKLIEIASERVQSSLTHKAMAEQEFKSGDILISELSRIDQIVAQAKSELERARAAYDEACKQLEVLIGTSLNEINP